MFSICVSDKIKFKLLTDKDSEKFYKLMRKNIDHLKIFMPRIMETKNIEDSRYAIKTFLNQLIENNGFRAAIFYNSYMVGVAGFKYIDWINKKTEIMYWIDQEHLRKGIITECVNKLIDIAFNEYNLNKIIIKSSTDNIASIRIAEKCDFILEGVNREDELLCSGYTDINVYSLLKKEREKRML